MPHELTRKEVLQRRINNLAETAKIAGDTGDRNTQEQILQQITAFRATLRQLP